MLVIVISAAPLNVLQQLVNSAVDGLNFIMAVLFAGINGLGQLVLGLVYGAVNWSIGGLYAQIAAWLPMVDWVILVPPTVNFTFVVDYVSFASMGLDVDYSPIGIFVSNFISDPNIANAIGAIGVIALVGLMVMLVMKAKK